MNSLHRKVTMTYYSSIFLLVLLFSGQMAFCAEEIPQESQDLRVHAAVRARDLNRLTDLFIFCVDLNERDERGWTPLHLAARLGPVSIVDFLVQKDIFGQPITELNATNKDGYTPLHIAIKAGRFKVVASLVKAGADPNARAYDDETPLYFAAKQGFTHIVKFLLKNGAFMDEPRGQGHCPLNVAVRGSHLSVMKILVNAGADVNAVDFHDQSPLQIAVGGDQVDSVRFLLENGAHTAIGEHYEENVLHEAASCACIKSMLILLDAGVDVNVRSDVQQTPLFYAVEVPRGLAAAQVLIRRGAELDARDDRMCTPLHYAVEHARYKHVALLVRQGADITAETTLHKTPLALSLDRDDFASEHKKSDYTNTVKELLKFGVKVSEDDLKRLKKYFPEYCSWLKEKKASLQYHLKETMVATMPRDLQDLVLTFVLSNIFLSHFCSKCTGGLL